MATPNNFQKEEELDDDDDDDDGIDDDDEQEFSVLLRLKWTDWLYTPALLLQALACCNSIFAIDASKTVI